MIEKGEYPGEGEEDGWFPEDESKTVIEAEKSKRQSVDKGKIVIR